MPVDGGGLDVQLESEAAERQLLEAILMEELESSPRDHVAVDLHVFSVAGLTGYYRTVFNISNNVRFSGQNACIQFVEGETT